MSDNKREFGMCEYYEDERGMCDRPHLVGGRCFSIVLDENFEVHTVSHNDKSFFVIKHDFCYFCFFCFNL